MTLSNNSCIFFYFWKLSVCVHWTAHTVKINRVWGGGGGEEKLSSLFLYIKQNLQTHNFEILGIFSACYIDIFLVIYIRDSFE